MRLASISVRLASRSVRLASISVRLALKRVSEAHKCETSFSWCEVGLRKNEAVLIVCTFVAQKNSQNTLLAKMSKTTFLEFLSQKILNTGFIL